MTVDALPAKPAPLASEDQADLLLMVRGIAALSVVFWHAGGYLEPYPAWMNIPGRTAVWIFFGISGYVIAHGFVHGRYGFDAQDLKDFYINRFLRIYPIFLTLTLVGWATEMVRTGSSPFSLEQLPAQLLAMQFNQDYVLNGVFWTLGIELHFYLLAPLLVIPLLSERRISYFWVPVLFYFTCIAWSVYAARKLGWSFDGRNLVACLPHFLAGMIACRMTAQAQPSRSRFLWALAIAVALVVATNFLYHRHPHRFWSWIGIVLVDGAIVALIVAHAAQAVRKGRTVTVLTTLGLLSYGLYAWHGYWMKVIPQLTEQALVLTGLSLLCAYLTYLCVERPSLRMKRVHVARHGVRVSRTVGVST